MKLKHKRVKIEGELKKMKLPVNKNGKYYLLNKKGEEVEFDWAIDAQEALFGVFNKDDKDENFEPAFFLPEDFDMDLKPKKNTGVTKEEMMVKQLKTGKRGRPPKEKKEPEIDPKDENNENKE